MKKFIIPLVVVLIAGAFVIGFFIGKGAQTTDDQSASIVRGVPSRMTANPGTPDPAYSYVWSQGVCWSVKGGPNGDVWSPTPFSSSGCPAISSHNNNIWANMMTFTTSSVPVNKINGKTVLTPAGIYVWKDGACWNVKGLINGGYQWSSTTYDLNTCPSIGLTPASSKIK